MGRSTAMDKEQYLVSDLVTFFFSKKSAYIYISWVSAAKSQTKKQITSPWVRLWYWENGLTKIDFDLKNMNYYEGGTH